MERGDGKTTPLDPCRPSTKEKTHAYPALARGNPDPAHHPDHAFALTRLTSRTLQGRWRSIEPPTHRIKVRASAQTIPPSIFPRQRQTIMVRASVRRNSGNLSALMAAPPIIGSLFVRSSTVRDVIQEFITSRRSSLGSIVQASAQNGPVRTCFVRGSTVQFYEWLEAQ